MTLLDPGFSGSPMSLSIDSSSNPAYQGQINGTGVLDMLAALNLMSSGSSASEAQGYPGPSIAGGAANNTIGILHRFSLTAGDQATFNSSFEAVVPEPGRSRCSPLASAAWPFSAGAASRSCSALNESAPDRMDRGASLSWSGSLTAGVELSFLALALSLLHRRRSR